jgi:hypothetical protein
MLAQVYLHYISTQCQSVPLAKCMNTSTTKVEPRYSIYILNWKNHRTFPLITAKVYSDQHRIALHGAPAGNPRSRRCRTSPNIMTAPYE